MRTKIYVDDTQLVHWQGHVAGIPRVMFELGRRFTTDPDHEIIHVSWVKEIKGFVTIDFDATMRRDRGVVYLDEDQTSSGPTMFATHSSPSLSMSGKQVAKKVVRKLGVDKSKLLQKARHQIANARARQHSAVKFEAGDTIVITWGEWWDENFLQLLERSVKDQVNIVPVIHDVLPFTQAPQFSGHSTDSLMAYCRRIVPISSLVLCVSQSTEHDLSQWLSIQKLPMPPMRVFRLGEDFEFAAAKKPVDEAFKRSGLRGDDYTLTVGTIEARKNHTLLYYVHKLAKRRGIELPKAVIVGRRGWKTEQLYDFMTEDPEVSDKFVFLHNASDEELSWLYDHALFSIYPSMYEGWGMPIAESVARGVPCICSNTTSMTEIAENYVVHFSPYSTDECLQSIQTMLDKERLHRYRTLVKKYKQTTWDESYQKVRQLMKETIDV